MIKFRKFIKGEDVIVIQSTFSFEQDLYGLKGYFDGYDDNSEYCYIRVPFKSKATARLKIKVEDIERKEVWEQLKQAL
jgi:hypothetical protein